MSGEILTQGTELWVLDTTASPDALLKLSNATGLGEFGPMSDDIEVTNLDSTAKEFLTGLPDNGEVSLPINYADIASHRWLEDNQGTGVRYYFCIGFSDGSADPTIGSGPVITAPASRTSRIFQATVKSFKENVDGNSVVKATVTLRISGAIERTRASGL
ncbi:MAG: hypothetical protein KDI69_03270 [Xanthomonadales bacterium]|nr:hypothetical protein [Xanthomonadales bacterium]